MQQIHTLFCALFVLFLPLDQISAQCSLQAGDLVITEIMPDPAAVSDTRGEYFEVYNITNSDIDMMDMVIKDDGINSHTINSSVIVPAGEYIVLGRDDDMTTNGGITVTYVLNTSFSLTNTEDEIIIECDGIVIDRVAYNADFPIESGESTSLSPNNLTATDNDNFNNWCLSESTYGDGDLGTPGAVNDACFIACPNVGDLVITEIMNNPSGSDTGKEYFEIYNTTNATIDLEGFVIKMDDEMHTINSSVTVAAMSYIVLGDNGDMATNGGIAIDYVYNNIVLGNTTNTLSIECNNAVLDAVAYDNGATFPDASGISMNLNPNQLDATANDDGNNWCEATTPIVADGDLGTPGAANDPCLCAINNVAILNTTCSGSDLSFEVSFAVENATGVYEVIDTDDNVLASGTSSPVSVIIIGNTSTASFDIRVRLQGRSPLCVSSNTSVEPLDCSVAINCPAAGDLVITEIMNDPTDETNGEYFEIYNASANPIDLYGFILKDNDSDNLTLRDPISVAAGAYFVLGQNMDMTANGNVPVDYAYTGFTLANGADEIILSCQNAVIDAVNYDDGTTFPNPAGASMNLDPDQRNTTDNDDGANWCASTTAIAGGSDLGTPGAANISCASLAVELLNFTAKLQATAVQLNWQTANENDHDRFVVERSTDGVQFFMIGQVTAQNVDNQIVSYEFLDTAPVSGENFYRLREMDTSEKSTYSTIVSVDFNAVNHVQLYPNPATEQLNIKGELGINTTYQIVDQLGNILQNGQLQDDKQIDLQTLPVGVYFLQLITENKRLTQRFLKQ